MTKENIKKKHQTQKKIETKIVEEKLAGFELEKLKEGIIMREKLVYKAQESSSKIVEIGLKLGVEYDALAGSSKERHKASLIGVPTEVVNNFIDRFHLTRKDLSSLLGITERTLYSQLKKDKLDEKTSDRFLLVNSVFEEGVDALMSDEAFIEWIYAPHSHFDKETPFSLLTTINGAEAVREELIRTKYGVLS